MAEDHKRKRLEAAAADSHVSVKKSKHPSGMEPGVKVDPNTGRGEAVVVVPAGQEPEWEALLKKFGFGEVLEFLDVVEVRGWETFSKDAFGKGKPGTVQLQYIKARVRRRAVNDRVDVEALIKQVDRFKPRKTPTPKQARRARVVCLADWQMGKKDGDGVKGTTERALRLIELVDQRLAEERPQRLVVTGMGDMVESCTGFYPMQTFNVDLDRRSQCRVVRHLVKQAVLRWAPRVPELVVACVQGNHGECADEETELLTRERGWVSLPDVAGNETIATMNPTTQAFEWQRMTAWNAYDHDGPMHRYKNSRGSLMVTPNHECYVAQHAQRNQGPEVWGLRKSSENTRRAGWMCAARDWKGTDGPVVIPPAVDGKGNARPGRTFAGGQLEDLAKFLGWYVSEGNGPIQGGRICISQNEKVNPDHHAAIIEVISALGFTPRPRWDQVRFCDYAMARWLSDEFGRTSYEKRLPRWLKEWPLHLLIEFMDAYNAGDAHVRPMTRTIAATTASDQLIDDLTEVLIKLGWRTNSSQPRYTRTVEGYAGTGRKLTYNPMIAPEQPKFTEEHYTGRVYCPTVPNGLWFSRRDGLVVVTGNSRRNGKAFTTFDDNDDVAIFEQLAEVFAGRPAFKHVSFVLPTKDMTVTLDVFGEVLGLAHGHQCRGRNSRKAVFDWWKSKALARHPLAEASVLVTGHRHHLLLSEFAAWDGGQRVWIQCPTLEGGSRWWTEQGGMPSLPGTLSFTLGEGGLADLEVFR